MSDIYVVFCVQLCATCDWKHTVPEMGGCVTIVQSVSVPLHAVAKFG